MIEWGEMRCHADGGLYVSLPWEKIPHSNSQLSTLNLKIMYGLGTVHILIE